VINLTNPEPERNQVDQEFSFSKQTFLDKYGSRHKPINVSVAFVPVDYNDESYLTEQDIHDYKVTDSEFRRVLDECLKNPDLGVEISGLTFEVEHYNAKFVCSAKSADTIQAELKRNNVRAYLADTGNMKEKDHGFEDAIYTPVWTRGEFRKCLDAVNPNELYNFFLQIDPDRVINDRTYQVLDKCIKEAGLEGEVGVRMDCKQASRHRIRIICTPTEVKHFTNLPTLVQIVFAEEMFKY
jgi:hypothetical protein